MKQAKRFEEMNWHDNHVHGFAIESGKDGTGELVLDIDHITEWMHGEGNLFVFMIAPSVLTFHEVFNLVVDINYAAPSMAITPFSIHGIHREPFSHPNGYPGFKWRIELNSPNGEIAFEASGFSQRATNEPIRSEGQFLSVEARSKIHLTDSPIGPTTAGSARAILRN